MKGRILLVDDEPTVRDVVLRFLTRNDFDVVASGSPEEAIGLFEQQPFDLVLTDLYMPGMSGMEMIERINRIDARVPKVILTGLSTMDDAIEAIHKGVVDYLLKPLDDMSQLEIVVNRAVEKYHLARENEEMRLRLEETNQALRDHVARLEEARTQMSMQAQAVRKANDLIQRQFELLQEDLLNARRIQQDLLPRVFPSAEGVSFAGFYLPSGKVGGDFYDVVHVDDDHLGFYIADAAGHGVGSAMITVFIKQTIVERLLVTAEQVPINPGDVLKEINHRLIARRFPRSMFLTAWYGLLHVSSGTLQYASAGHHPSLAVGRDGRLRELSSGGIALGWTGKTVYLHKQAHMKPGDRLLLYTDGLTDAKNDGNEPFGKRRLAGALVENRRLAPRDLLEALLEELSAFAGDRAAADDVSLLLVGWED